MNFMDIINKIKKKYYFNKEEYDYVNSNKKMIFILGTGRSGTHWIGYILGDHPEVYTTIEKEPIFSYSTQMALNPNLRPELFPELVKLYKKEFKNMKSQKYYLDKSHPNLWLAEALNNIFPNAYFIAMKRNPYATISSMIKHKGVLIWQNNYYKYPLPNNFLGIKGDIISEYENLSIETQCALRWKSHVEKIENLKGKLNSKLLVLNYEELINNTKNELKKIKEFLKMEENIPFPKVKSDSLNKWKKNLTKEQIRNIDRTLK